MHYSFSNSLGRPFINGIDADAKAYIDAIVAQGATVTGAQRKAINDFVVAEKAASRWTSIGRFYLPVWGIAAANAVCLKSLTSGTFVGTVTHGSGFVQGNGSTGYFDMGVTPASVGMTTGSGSLFAVVKARASGVTFGLVGANNTRMVATTGQIQGRMTNNLSGANLNVTEAQVQNGVHLTNRTSTTSLIQYLRKAGGLDTSSTFATANGTAAESVYTCMALGRKDSSGNPANLSTTEFGAYGMGLGFADPSAFTLNLKTLWETVTGLTLP